MTIVVLAWRNDWGPFYLLLLRAHLRDPDAHWKSYSRVSSLFTFHRERCGMRGEQWRVHGQVCTSMINSWDGSVPWHLRDLSSHIQPLVEIYCVPVICISTNNACNFDSCDSEEKCSKGFRSDYNGKMGTSVVYQFLKKNSFHMLFSGKLYSIYAFFFVSSFTNK